MHLLRLLDGVQHEPRQSHRGPTDLRAALVRAATLIKRRSLVIIVSDFMAPDGWQSALGLLTQRHEVLAVRTSDPREQALADVGLVTLEDPETGAQLLVDTSDGALRERFQEAARRQEEQLCADLHAHGIDLLTLSTAESALSALLRFLAARNSARIPGVTRFVSAASSQRAAGS